MPITLQKMAANTADLVIKFGEDDINITYYPGRVTDKLLAQLAGLNSLTEETMLTGLGEFNATVANLIKAWDIYDEVENEEGEKVQILLPITAQGVSALPIPFRAQLVSAITGDMRPPEKAPQKTIQNSSH